MPTWNRPMRSDKLGEPVHDRRCPKDDPKPWTGSPGADSNQGAHCTKKATDETRAGAGACKKEQQAHDVR